MAPSRSGYQPLSQNADDADERYEYGVAGEGPLLPQPVTAGEPSRGRMLRRNAPRSIDLGKLDTAFKRWAVAVLL
jgi:hypothetical protein